MLRFYMVVLNIVLCLFYGHALVGLKYFDFNLRFEILIAASLGMWLVTSGVSVLYGEYIAPSYDLGCMTIIILAPIAGIAGLYVFQLISSAIPNVTGYQYMVIGGFIGIARLPDYLVYKMVQVRI